MATEAPEAAPTPQPENNKSAKKKVAEPGFAEQFADFVQFLRDTWIEFRRISWPNRQQVVKETWSVLVLVTLLTVSVLGFDFAIARTVFEPLDKFAKHQGGGVGGSVQQKWGPMQAPPNAPLNSPANPGNALPTQKALPAGSQGTSGAPAPVPVPLNAPPTQAPTSDKK